LVRGDTYLLNLTFRTPVESNRSLNELFFIGNSTEISELTCRSSFLFVMIRFIENTSSGLIYKSGGGITAMSDAISEYEEMIQKVYVPVI